MLRLYRKMGEDAARSGDSAKAISLAKQGVTLAEGAASEKNVSTSQRIMVPRSYAASASIADLLGRKEEAFRWRKKAYDAYRALSGESEFNSLYQEELRALQIASERTNQ